MGRVGGALGTAGGAASAGDALRAWMSGEPCELSASKASCKEEIHSSIHVFCVWLIPPICSARVFSQFYLGK